MIPKKRPQPVTRPVVSDADADNNNSDDSEELPNPQQHQYAQKRMTGSKRPRLPAPSDDDNQQSDDDNDNDSEEDEDEDSEADSDSEKQQPPPQKRRKGQKSLPAAASSSSRRAANPFIQEEAEVDTSDEDEADDSGEDLEDEFLDNQGEAAEAGRLQPEMYQMLDKKRREEEFGAGADEFDADELSRRYQEKYGRAYTSATSAAGEYRGDSAQVPAQFLLPTAQDPKLWLVRCKPGKENDVALNLMRKYLDLRDSTMPMRIFSVVSRPALKGYIYVEARSMDDVKSALDKMLNVYLSRVTLIPQDEMVDILTIRKKEVQLKPGAWVRMTRGKYKGDLAQVLEVTDNNDSLHVKLIPRIDYVKPKLEGDNAKKKSAQRPQQKFFNAKDVDKSDRTLTRGNGFWSWGGDKFDKNGFLERDVKLSSLDTENIQPSLEEISKFSSATNADDSGSASQESNLVALAESAHNNNDLSAASINRFQPGDLVTITEGDLVNAQGIIKAVSPATITLIMKDEELGELLIEPGRLVKAYVVGDHIRVFRGKWKDMKGMVTQVQNDVITAFSDDSMEQFSVFARDIQSAGEVPIRDAKLSVYSLHDFVQLGPTNVGVIISADNDQYRILDQNGTILSVKTQEITQKRDTKRAVSMDSAQNTIQCNDVVQVLIGEHSGKQGSILHLYRTWAFLYHRDMSETSGIFVVRTRMILKMGSGVQGLGNGPAAAGPAANGAFRVPGAPSAFRFDPLLQKRIVITTGPYKGYQGILKAVTDKGARIELNSNGRVVTVDRSKIRPQDGPTSALARDNDRFSRFQGGATPMHGSKTPSAFAGAQTPNVHKDGIGQRTPAWDAGSKTPAWGMSETQGRYGRTDGDSSRTPAWDSGARTPQVHSGASPSGQSVSYESAPSSSSAPNVVAIVEWVEPGMEVSVSDEQYANAHGRVLAVKAGVCQLEILSNPAVSSSGQTIDIRTTHLQAVPPSKKDSCMFLRGHALAGRAGSVVGFDGLDAIVKLDDEEHFDIVTLSRLCKLCV